MDIVIQIRIIPVKIATILLLAMHLEAAHRISLKINHRIAPKIVIDEKSEQTTDSMLCKLSLC